MNYGEDLCQSVDIIITKRLEGIAFDSTILCTITNDKKRDQGSYTVSNNGNLEFEAYSSNTNYRKNDNVYVQIPGNNWEEQKFIIAKKSDKTNEPFIYNKPLNSLVDITDNLIDKKTSQEKTGLLANKDDDNNRSKVIWEYNVKNDKELIKSGFTRLGLKAGFQALTHQYYDEKNNLQTIVEGDYGLKLTIISNIQILDANQLSQETAAAYIMYLNCNDMNGNPYNFSTFYEQEKLFNISEIQNINQIKLEFYQVPGSFKDKNGNTLPYQDFQSNDLDFNLFVNNITLSLGYGIEEFENEMVQIYTNNSNIYSSTKKVDNSKEMSIRWVHKQENGQFKSITIEDALDYEIRWYRFELGRQSADEYSGAYWKKLAVVKFEKEKEPVREILDEDWKNSDKVGETDYFTAWLFPNIALQNEQVKAIIIYNNQVYRSNILTFQNDQEVVNQTTLNATQALSIVCEDGSFGNYYLYNPGNSIIDNSHSNLPRTLSLKFYDSELQEAESVKWIIPEENSMIEKIGEKENNKYEYKIKSYYTQTNNNNIVQCKIVKNGITYIATKELKFGVAGTSGTDHTFVLNFVKDNAITIENTSVFKVVAKLFDFDNKEINISDKKVNWNWKTSDGNIEIVNKETNKTAEVELQLKTEITSLASNYNILQATLAWGDYNLVAYLPIPIKQNNGYSHISGPTQIIYDSAGKISVYSQKPYELYDSSFSLVNVTWEIINANTDEGAFSPTLKKDNKLQPLSFYVEDACEKVCLNAKIDDEIVWSQPILIIQNRYPSAMLNSWDGNLSLGENNGTILAPRIAAGKKVGQNRFSGVILGDWQTKENEKSIIETGLYGFYQGTQSFGFKNDGTAFIGTSGAGRIEFDGSQGIIQSANFNWTSNKTGMQINLLTGKIQAKDVDLYGRIEATSGKIGDWEISGGAITNNYTTLSSDGKISCSNIAINGGSINIGVLFEVDSIGQLTASNANISGTITASDGNIGEWEISDGSITNGNATLGSDGSININDKFKVDESGNVTLAGIISWGNNGAPGAGAQEAAKQAQEDVKSLANGTYPGSFIDGQTIRWSDQGDVGTLSFTKGSTGTQETHIVLLHSNSGMTIEAESGGLRLYGSAGIWLNNSPEEIKMRDGTDYISIKQYIEDMVEAVLSKNSSETT